jgi:hypothetical protein
MKPILDTSSTKQLPKRHNNGGMTLTLRRSTSILSLSDTRSLGLELVASWAYESLEVDKALRNAGILARLVSPGSDAKTYRYVREPSAISELVGIELIRQ